MASGRRTILSTGMVIGATIAVLVAAGALLTITHSNSAARQQRLVVASFETIALMRQALVAMQDAESSERGFLLTGEVASLEPYERARLRVDTLLRQLEAAGGEGDSARQIAEFRSAATEKLEELGASISIYQRQGRDAAVEPEKLIASRATSDHIRQAADAFVEGQRLLLARRNLGPELAKPGPHRRVGQGLDKRRIEPVDDAAGGALGRPQAEPVRRVESRQAGFVDARNLRGRRKPRLCGDGERLDVSAAHLRQGARGLVEHQRDVVHPRRGEGHGIGAEYRGVPIMRNHAGKAVDE